MAKKDKDPTPVEGGPPYPANWIIDENFRPETIIDRHRRNAGSPAVHDAYRRAVEEKVEKHGVIHRDQATGYLARFKPTDAAA